ncbi:MAG: VOC family protein [Deltaproteobacteria bacterium]|nr:VOC family protein [Deltaproteobacteria bacterium]
MRLQLALNVSDLEKAVDFYSRMFGAPVHKRKPGYANFAIEDPPLKLVLFERPGAGERINHLGVEVFREEDVAAARERLEGAGIDHRIETETHCCHATQNKVWATEPDGLPWEWYRITDDTDALFPAPDMRTGQRRQADCCSD